MAAFAPGIALVQLNNQITTNAEKNSAIFSNGRLFEMARWCIKAGQILSEFSLPERHSLHYSNQLPGLVVNQ